MPKIWPVLQHSVYTQYVRVVKKLLNLYIVITKSLLMSFCEETCIFLLLNNGWSVSDCHCIAGLKHKLPCTLPHSWSYHWTQAHWPYCKKKKAPWFPFLCFLSTLSAVWWEFFSRLSPHNDTSQKNFPFFVKYLWRKLKKFIKLSLNQGVQTVSGASVQNMIIPRS